MLASPARHHNLWVRLGWTPGPQRPLSPVRPPLIRRTGRYKKSRHKIEIFYFLANGWLERAFAAQNELDIRYYTIHATEHPEAPKLMARAYRNRVLPLEPSEQLKLELFPAPKAPSSDVSAGASKGRTQRVTRQPFQATLVYKSSPDKSISFPEQERFGL